MAVYFALDAANLNIGPTMATQEIEAFMLTYNIHMAHPFEWRKGVRFYQRLKDKLSARPELQLAEEHRQL
jgi:hypothetical protein